jgi:cobalamin biosynthesis Mg chelatase CobN
MSPPLDRLPPDVLDALRAGRVLEATRLLRTRPGVGLKEARLWIEQARQALLTEPPRPGAPVRMVSNAEAPARPASSTGASSAPWVAAGVPADVIKAFQAGRPLDALRLLLSGAASASGPVSPGAPPPRAGSAPGAVRASRPAVVRDSMAEAARAEALRRRRGLSPGEVPRPRVPDGWVLLLVIGALLAWVWWRSPG